MYDKYYRRLDDSQIYKLISDNYIDYLYRYIVFKPDLHPDLVNFKPSQSISVDKLICSTDDPFKAIEAAQQAPTEILFDVGNNKI